MFEESKNSLCAGAYFTQVKPLGSFELIAVTDSKSCSRTLWEQAQRIAAYEHKPTKLILRAKELSEGEYVALVKQVLPICREQGVELVLHTHWRLALQLGLSKVQLPLPLLASTDADFKGSKLKIMTSVHSITEAQQALQLGAEALVAGHIYATDCKRGLAPRGLEFLRSICAKSQNFTKAKHQLAVPVYAIGGIKFSYEQWEAIKNAGASGACIMSGYMKI
ncbi:MAG: thiamine phosphate synthase [Phascolarctobacterium sp.]|nr:thiamine phosphate synthase [Phascolarctobacterium sp.]